MSWGGGCLMDNLGLHLIAAVVEWGCGVDFTAVFDLGWGCGNNGICAANLGDTWNLSSGVGEEWVLDPMEIASESESELVIVTASADLWSLAWRAHSLCPFLLSALIFFLELQCETGLDFLRHPNCPGSAGMIDIQK